MSKAEKLERHLERWYQAQDGRVRWTREAVLDRRYVAGKTWTMLEMEIFMNEAREAPNYNLLLPIVNLMCGVEAQSRQDINYLPRTPKDADGASAATKLSALVRDQNQGDRQLSRQFRDAVTIGVGWMEVGYNADPHGFDLLRRRVDPFHIYADPCGKDPDMGDWIDVFRSVITYPEQLAMRFPAYRKEILGHGNVVGDPMGLSHSADYTNLTGDRMDVWMYDVSGTYGQLQPFPVIGGVNRPRQVRAVERWYKVEEWERFVKLRDGRLFCVDGDMDPQMVKFLSRQLVETDGMGRPMAKYFKGLAKCMRVALFMPDNGGLLLSDGESPYKHHNFPFVPMWAYEDDRAVPMGVVRQLRTPQRDFNARMAHMLKRSLTNQVHFEEGAFIDEDEAAAEITKSNGMVRYSPGALAAGKVRVENNLASAPLEKDILNLDQLMIQDYSGVTQELLGQETNAKSGTAIQARQSQGQTRMYTLFDNRNWTHEEIARLELANIQATFTEEMVIRVTDSANGMGFVTINQTLPDGTVANDITNAIFDVKASLTKQHDTAQLAVLEQITTLAGQMPPQMQALWAPNIAKMAAQATAIPESADMIRMLETVRDTMLQQMVPPPQPQGPDPQAMDSQAAMMNAQANAAKTQAMLGPTA